MSNKYLKEFYGPKKHGYGYGLAGSSNLDKKVKAGQSRGSMAKPYPLGGMLKDPDERPELQDEAGLFGGDQDKITTAPEPGETPAPEPQDNIQTVLQKNQELLASKKNVDVSGLKKLGTGTQGTAFDMGGDKVLKVTKDAQEARASNKIIDQGLKYVAKIEDVFRFQNSNLFGIIQEKLTPLSAEEEKDFNLMMVYTGIPVWLKHSNTWDEAVEKAFNYVIKKKGDGNPKSEKSKTAIRNADQFFDRLENTYHMKDMWEELKQQGIKFHDFQAANLMKRGSEYVLIDIGLSDVSGGGEPPMLEKITRLISQFILEQETADEKEVDSAWLWVDEFQPFHRGHAEIARQLARQYAKVVIVPLRDRPFPFELTKKTIELSLPEIMDEIEVHRPTWKGAASDYIPGIISDIIVNSESAIEANTGINVVARNPQQAEKINKQFADEAQSKKTGINIQDYLVTPLNNQQMKIDQDASIENSEVMRALKDDNKDQIEKLLDPHIISNPQEFDELYGAMRDSLTGETEKEPQQPQAKQEPQTKPAPEEKPSEEEPPEEKEPEEKPVQEKLADVGADAIVKTLELNKQRLRDKGIYVERLDALGHGQMGIAFDMGNKRVFKVTTDEAEARASFSIKDKTLSHVVKIYDVFQFGKTTVPEDLFGIVQERLVPLDNDEKRKVETTFSFIDDHKDLIEVMYQSDFKQFKQALYEKIREDVVKELGVDPHAAREKINKITVLKFRRLIKSLKELKIPEMMGELKTSGIKFADYHSENLMKRDNGDFVINDLGLSQSGGGRPPVFEKFMGAIEKHILKEFGYPGSSVTFTGAPGWTAAQGKAQSSPWSSATLIKKPIGKKKKLSNKSDEEEQ